MTVLKSMLPRNKGDSTPYHISVYDKIDDFDFRIVYFPHMDNNIQANPAYGILKENKGGAVS